MVVGEAWASRGQVSADVLGMDIRVAEHPLRDEILLLAGAWPREHLLVSATAEVVCDERGQNPQLRPWGPPELGSCVDVGASTWPLQVLPGPR